MAINKRKVGKIALVASLPLALFSGCVGGVVIGADNEDLAAAAEQSRPAPTATVTATPEPAPTVTETAEPEPAPTETVTETPEPEIETVIEEVETVPLSCTEAIEAGDVLIESMLSWGDYVPTAELEVAEDAAFDWGFWSEVCKDAAG